MERFKARLVVQGFRQVPGVDYFESYSPTTKMETVKILLTIVACEDLHCEILDAKNAYTQADLLEGRGGRVPDNGRSVVTRASLSTLLLALRLPL